ncbi:hypothetical protein D9M70_524330 [compost metagenome]
MRGVRAVGLVLVDEGRGGIQVAMNIIGSIQDTVGPRPYRDVIGAGQDHEVGRAARHEQGVIRLQGNEYRAVVGLLDKVQAMVEELAEEGEPGVERRRQSFVRRGVRDGQERPGGNRHIVQVQQGPGGEWQPCRRIDLGAIGQGSLPGLDEGLNHRRVVAGLVGYQVGDDARIGVDHIAGHRPGGGVVGIADTRERNFVLFVAEGLRQEQRKELIRRTEGGLSQTQVVE